MKSFYLHVGLPRCASTLIENIFLKPNYDAYHALLATGIKPLPRLYSELRRAADRPNWDNAFHDHLRDYHLTPMLHHDADGFFTSDESLTNFSDEPGTPLLYPDRVPFLARLLDGFKPRILMLIRNQASYMLSRYGLHLQNGGILNFDEFIDNYPLNHLDWLSVAETFVEYFGKNQVTVLPFEKDIYSTSGTSSSNFLDALQRAMGVASPVKLENQLLVNPSLNPKYFTAQLNINRADDPEAARRANPIPETEDAYVKSDTDSPLTQGRKSEILAHFQESNRRLFNSFMPGFNGADFYMEA